VYFFCRKFKQSAEECDCVAHLTATDIKNNHVPVFVLLASSDLAKYFIFGTSVHEFISFDQAGRKFCM
jgi:hypothetical protein